MEKKSAPPSASAILKQHTQYQDDFSFEAVPGGGVNPTDIVSNLIEGLVGGGGAAAADDDASVGSRSSMKHRMQRSNSYDQRAPKLSGGKAVPYRGFGSRSGAVAPTPDSHDAHDGPGLFGGLGHRFRFLFSPRATDIQQLLIKLQTQFDMLEVEHKKYHQWVDKPSEYTLSKVCFAFVSRKYTLLIFCHVL